MAGGLVGSGVGLDIGCGGNRGGRPVRAASPASWPDGSRVTVRFQCGDLAVDTSPGSSWTVEGASEDGSPPTIGRDGDGITVEAADDERSFGFSGVRERWDITLPTDPTIDLDVELNAGAGRLTLPGAHLASVDVTVNAGSLRIDLRDVAAASTIDGTVNAGSAVIWLPQRALQGDLTVNAGSLSICAPGDVGLRLATGDNPLSSNNFDDEGLDPIGRCLGNAGLRHGPDPDRARCPGERGQHVPEPAPDMRGLTRRCRRWILSSLRSPSAG